MGLVILSNVLGSETTHFDLLHNRTVSQ